MMWIISQGMPFTDFTGIKASAYVYGPFLEQKSFKHEHIQNQLK